MWIIIIIGIGCVMVTIAFFHHQRRLRLRAHLMQEAIRNRDFTFRLPTKGMFSGERAMQETMNLLGETIRQQVNKNEVESWERLTRVLTHEIMNATAPISSISQSLLSRKDVIGTPVEDGIRAIHDTSQHMSRFVTNYRKMSQLEDPVMANISLYPILYDISTAYPQLSWEINVSSGTLAWADGGMLRQVLMNLVKNAIEAGAKRMLMEEVESESHEMVQLLIGNDGQPIPAENLQSIFVPFFTTKRSGNGIGLALSRRMMILQKGMLDLAEPHLSTCHAAFMITLQRSSHLLS